MDQHPVPRNISGFQFHLIGDMTLRQFGYLVGGGVLGFIMIKAAPFPSFVKYGFAGTFALAGFAFAFLPIQERPLDKWLFSFIKSIYAPTQYLWQKEGFLPEALTSPASAFVKVLPSQHFNAHNEARKKLAAYLASLPVTPHQTLNIREKNYVDKTLLLFSTTPAVTNPLPTVQAQPDNLPLSVTLEPLVISSQTTSPSPIPAISPRIIAVTTPPVFSPSSTLQPLPSPAKQELPITPNLNPATDYSKLQKEMAALSAEKDALTRELELLKGKTGEEKKTRVVKPFLEVEPKTPTIKSVTPRAAVFKIGLPSLPQYPNLVIGVVKDSSNRILPNILITIKDKSSIPLRALKTNKLGQFASATPLPNGIYYIETEDPMKRYLFDVAEITLSGKIFLPIEITAKGEKEMIREQLTKAIFGNASA